MVLFCPVLSQNLASKTHPLRLPPLASFFTSFATQASSVPSPPFEQYHSSQILGFSYAHKENRDQAPPTPMLSNLWPRKKPLSRAQYTALCHEAMKSLSLKNCGAGYQTARTPSQSQEALHNSEDPQMFRPLRENLYVFYH